MGIKFKVFLIAMVVVFTGTMFAGCDSWSRDYNNTRPPITTGTNPTDKNNDPNFSESNEDLVDDDDMIDESAIYEFLDGVKLNLLWAYRYSKGILIICDFINISSS